MAKYLVKASYNKEGIQGIMKEGGSGRAAAVEQLMKSVGGKVDAFYFAFGESDVYVIVDLPDHGAAAAVAAAVGSGGALSSYETIVLLTPAEMDAAMKKTAEYRRPGG
jgi:uncharacterized protein with GYD domain